MLVLTRKQDEQILIGDDVVITVIKIRNNQIRLGISAPRDVRVLRGELEAKVTEVTIDLDDNRPVSVLSGTINTSSGKVALESSSHSRSPLGAFFTAP